MHPLAVRLHLQLLQERRQATQGVGVGRHGAGGPVQAVNVEDLGQGQKDRGVPLQRGRDEVIVHGRRPGQHGLEHVPAQGDGARQADRRPQRIASADPVPEREGAAAAEGRRLVRRRRHPDEVFRHAFDRQGGRQPGLGRLGVGQGFLGGEGLGHHHDQGGLGIEPRQGLGHVAGVDVGDETQVDGRLQRPQGVPHHARTQVRAADADMDDGFEPFARRPRLGARAHGLGIGLHVGAHRLHLGRDRLAQGLEVGAGRGPQGRMQHGPALGQVDGLAGEQGGATALDVAGVGQVQTGLEGFPGPALFRQIQIETRRLDRHPRQPVRIGGELVHDTGFARRCGGGVEGGPGVVAGHQSSSGGEILGRQGR